MFEPDASFFMPHGHCFFWRLDILLLHAGSDAVIAIAYTAISIALFLLIRKRKSIEFRKLLILFSSFIFFCGLTHALDIVSLWNPIYFTEGIVKTITAGISGVTALLLWPILPKMINLPLPSELAKLNSDLKREIEDKQAAQMDLIKLNAFLEDVAEKRAKHVERLAKILEKLPDAVITFGTKENVTYANKSAEIFFDNPEVREIDPEKLIFLNETWRSQFLTQIHSMSPNVLTLNKDRVQTSQDWEWMTHPLSLDHLNDGYVFLARDVTDQKQDEIRFRVALESSPLSKLLVDDQGCIEFANPQCLETFGYSPEELLGQKIDKLIPRRFHLKHQSHFSNFLENPSTRSMSTGQVLYAKTKSGKEIPVEISLGPFVHAGRIHILTSIVDITQRLESLKTLEKKTLELEHANSNLESFVYAASHDLQEPLRAILGYLQLFQRRYGDSITEEGRHFLKEAERGGERLRNLMRELLHYLKTGMDDETVTIDLNVMLKEILGDLEAAIEESQAQIEIGPLPSIQHHPVEIRKIFQNLIANSIKFRSASPLFVKVSCRESPLGTEFIVSDNGLGIPEEFHERVFKLFQRLHNRSGGFGIGLALVAKAVRSRGGNIRFESKPGSGTTFIFTLSSNIPTPDSHRQNESDVDPHPHISMGNPNDF